MCVCEYVCVCESVTLCGCGCVDVWMCGCVCVWICDFVWMWIRCEYDVNMMWIWCEYDVNMMWCEYDGRKQIKKNQWPARVETEGVYVAALVLLNVLFEAEIFQPRGDLKDKREKERKKERKKEREN